MIDRCVLFVVPKANVSNGLCAQMTQTRRELRQELEGCQLAFAEVISNKCQTLLSSQEARFTLAANTHFLL